MWTILFYLIFLIVGSILEFDHLLHTKSNLEESQEMRKQLKINKEKGINELVPGQLGSCFSSLFYFSFTFAGLITSQWPLFLMLILLGLIPKTKIWWIKVDAVISLLLIGFIIINKFHLKIDFTYLLSTLL